MEGKMKASAVLCVLPLFLACAAPIEGEETDATGSAIQADVARLEVKGKTFASSTYGTTITVSADGAQCARLVTLRRPDAPPSTDPNEIGELQSCAIEGGWGYGAITRPTLVFGALTYEVRRDPETLQVYLYDRGLKAAFLPPLTP